MCRPIRTRTSSPPGQVAAACVLRVDCRRDRVARPGEDEEERVALRVHLDTARRAEGIADDPAMRGQDLAVVVPEPLEELRGVLDVGEDESDGSNGQLDMARSYVADGCQAVR